MVLIVYGEGLGDFSPIRDFVDPDVLVFATKTPTSTTLLVPGGAGVELTGTGFVYSPTAITAGVLDSIRYFDAAGHDLFTISGLEVTVQPADFDANTHGMVPQTFAGDDLALGSSHRDIVMDLGGGSDTLRGGLGNDFIGTSNGRDRLIGGRGSDEFVFVERLTVNRGVDVVVDFADGGLPSDDKLSVDGSTYYYQMVVTQTARGALLDFGDYVGKVLILGASAESIGIDDFIFNSILFNM